MKYLLELTHQRNNSNLVQEVFSLRMIKIEKSRPQYFSSSVFQSLSKNSSNVKRYSSKTDLLKTYELLMYSLKDLKANIKQVLSSTLGATTKILPSLSFVPQIFSSSTSFLLFFIPYFFVRHTVSPQHGIIYSY